MSSRIKEWVSVVVMLAATGFFWVQTPEQTAQGASIFPVLVMSLMLALAGIKVATILLFGVEEEKKKEIPEDEKPDMRRFWFVVGTLTAYVFAVDYIGFYVSSFVFFFGVSLAIQLEERTVKAMIIRLAVVLGFLYGCNILFTKVLLAQLPRGILF